MSTTEWVSPLLDLSQFSLRMFPFRKSAPKKKKKKNGGQARKKKDERAHFPLFFRMHVYFFRFFRNKMCYL